MRSLWLRGSTVFRSAVDLFETVSDIKGRCFTIKRLDEDLADLKVGVKSGLKLQLFLHDEGEQFWLSVGNFPFNVGSVIIDTTVENGPLVKYFSVTNGGLCYVTI